MAVCPLTPCEPPFGLATVQLRLVNDQSVGGAFSVTVYVWKVVMLSKSCSFVPPDVVRLKLDSGFGLAVKPNVAFPPVVFFTMWMKPGKMTASAESERSWLPPEPSRSTRRVWYGEPGMVMAASVSPQPPEPLPVFRCAMWPPHARTGFATLAVKWILMAADLSPVKPVPEE